ncbi:MAG TPA: hypothetical protein VFW12_06885 [Candidatus Limnocylindria bacterium]|nr:hypothetical protein [Candidatus Limnocylindria bacterium]
MARPILSSTAGILIGAALVGAAALRLAPEPAVVPVTAVPAVVAPLAPAVAAPLAPAVAAEPGPAAIASEAPAPVPTAAPAVAAPAPVAPAPPAITAAPYRSGGRAYAAVSAAPGATLESPLAGRVEVRLYQLINGEIRTGANVAGLAYFPYVIVRSSDRVLTLRPGALGVDSEILVKDGATVTAGVPLLRVTGPGPSSWRTFYDRTLEAQVLVSLTTTGGADLDAVPLFARH